jgi:molybdopterin converting factor small subunit
MSVQVLFFGKLVEITGASVVLEKIHDTDELLQQLRQTYPALATEKYLIAVDKRMITANTVLTNNCTVALLPPFSGG